MSAENDVRFSIPAFRVAGFKKVLKQTNAAAKQAGLKTIQLIHEGDTQNGHQSFLVRCADRTKIPFAELSGFIQDAEDGRPFKRSTGDKPIW